jgi:SPP1 gp7 family putative phage head morphogenesis protein
MRGKRLALPAGVALRYAAKLDALVAAMCADVSKQFARLLEHPDVAAHFGQAMDISPASQTRILSRALRDKWSQIFGGDASDLAQTMLGQADKASASATYSSLKELSGGLSLKTDFIKGRMREMLKASISENVSLIKSIPAEYFAKIESKVMRSITSGHGLEDLVPFFEEQEGMTARRAKNIAIDQTHKAYNGFNKGRMQAGGVKSYEWVHSGGGLHPRRMHQDMSGKIYRFDKPPIIEENGERGIPGQAINCRCTMVPVIQFEAGEPKP